MAASNRFLVFGELVIVLFEVQRVGVSEDGEWLEKGVWAQQIVDHLVHLLLDLLGLDDLPKEVLELFDQVVQLLFLLFAGQGVALGSPGIGLLTLLGEKVEKGLHCGIDLGLGHLVHKRDPFLHELLQVLLLHLARWGGLLGRQGVC